MFISLWLSSKPGPFAGRTPEIVWRSAYENFLDGKTGPVRNQFDFMLRVQRVGFDVIPTGLGGYVLDSEVA